MLKWGLIFVGGIACLAIAFLLFFAFMVWNHERGFPKSILSEDLKDSCVISRVPLVLRKRQRGAMSEKMWHFLPIPEGHKHIYGAYEPGSLTDNEGVELINITDAIEVPAGTRFILKDGFQSQNINSRDYYYWLEPEGIKLDSSFFYTPYGLEFEGPEDTSEIVHDRSEEMSQFPNNALFKKDRQDEAK